jgi:hypothetical protein
MIRCKKDNIGPIFIVIIGLTLLIFVISELIKSL